MSAFNIWDPGITSKQRNELQFVLTNGDIPSGIPQDQSFVESILGQLEIPARPVKWEANPYRTSYYSEYLDSDDWRDVWQLVWKVLITTDQEISISLQNKNSWIGTNAAGKGPLRNSTGDTVRCLIVANFADEVALKNAQDVISLDKKIDEWRNQYRVEKPIMSHLDVIGKYIQLYVDLGSFPTGFFINGADYAVYVTTLCQELGGASHFEAHLHRK